MCFKTATVFLFFFLTPRLCSAWIFLIFHCANFPSFFYFFKKHVSSKSSRLFRAHTSSSLLSSTPLGTTDLREGLSDIFRGITMGRGPIWGIHSLSPFILSWYSLLVEMSVSEQKRRGPFHASVSISQEVNGWKLRFLRVAYQLNNHQKNSLLKVVV